MTTIRFMVAHDEVRIDVANEAAQALYDLLATQYYMISNRPV